MKEGWKIIPFENVCLSMTKGPFGSDIKKSLYVPKSESTYKVYIQANAIEKDLSIGDYYISKEYFDAKMFRFEVKPGDYIITCDGTLGKLIRLPQTIERGIISASLLRITLGNQIIPRYFEYLWDGYILSRLTKDIRNSALVHLPSATKIGKVLIPVPSLSEQELIVAELDLLTGIIDKQKQQLGELDTLAQSIFYDMFGDPVENEKGWEKSTIGSLSECVAGATPSTKIREYWENGTIPWLSSGEVSQGRIFSTNARITQVGYNNASTKLIPSHTVLIALAGQGKTRGTVGVAEIPLCTNQSICSIITNSSIDVDFLYYQLKYQYNELRGISNGDGGRGGLNLKLIQSFKVIIPPLSLQQSFAQKIQSIESQKASINRSIAETQKLFDYTMDKYFG